MRIGAERYSHRWRKNQRHRLCEVVSKTWEVKDLLIALGPPTCTVECNAAGQGIYSVDRGMDQVLSPRLGIILSYWGINETLGAFPRNRGGLNWARAHHSVCIIPC